jgi:hypothetical protein
MRLVLARMQPVASMIAIAVTYALVCVCICAVTGEQQAHCRGVCVTLFREWWEVL